MNNEVKGEIDKLQTTVRWDEEERELVAILKFWAKGVTPAELWQLYEFQRSGALSFSITSRPPTTAQPSLFPKPEAAPAQEPGLPPVAGADKTPDYSTTEE